MRYLGIAISDKGKVTMPDAFIKHFSVKQFEAVEIDETILLLRSPLDQECFSTITELAEQSIEEHHRTLEGLAK